MEKKARRITGKGFIIVETRHYPWKWGTPVPMVVEDMGNGVYQAYPEGYDYGPTNDPGVTFYEGKEQAEHICGILNQKKYAYGDEVFEVRPARRTLTIGI